MKCPKCGYLGFETGDRCKNCGYDFALLAGPSPQVPDVDIPIRTDDPDTAAPELWLDRLDRSMDEASKPCTKQEHLIGVPEGPPPDPNVQADTGLPLFNPDDPDDIPLIALPTAPRPPLAVRRPAEASRLRAVPRAPRTTPAPALDFHEEAPVEHGAAKRPVREEVAGPTAAPQGSRHLAGAARDVGGRRLAAALIDHLLLAAIDAAVIYFTARMAGLTVAEIRMLPLIPMVTFIAIVKLSYFIAFTAVGGQTIGKMAMGIRVVAEHGSIDAGCAIRRTLAGLLTVLTAGLGFLPAFFGEDRRTLHDRLTGTRVVGLPGHL
jgi:uncharacterized RDD family membrane protein YckC